MTPNSKYENNWQHKTLENLEKNQWSDPEYHSHLVSTCHLLRKKPLNEFETEDLRIMIGQNIGLKYLIPLALDILKEDILAEGAFYEGDLLKAVLTSDKKFWKQEKELFNILTDLVYDNEKLLGEGRPDLLICFTEM